MSNQNKKRGMSVSAKISLGFLIVLALHISIAVMNHYGLSKAQADLELYDDLHVEVQAYDEIDRVVGSLQRDVLLFAFQGHQGPELRAAKSQDALEILLKQAARRAAADVDREAIQEMQKSLETHREILEAVVVDRANRRRLVNEVLKQYGEDFENGITTIAEQQQDPGRTDPIVAAFRAAQLETLQFVNAPDSMHVRAAKLNIAETQRLLKRLASDVDSESRRAAVNKTLAAVENYDAARIQMVQATRGYLHLVNVVLAGESEEFRRQAGEIRKKRSRHVSELAASMTADSKRFQFASNVFSVLTILLGVYAAWAIGRDVAPPLNAIADTFDGLTSGRSCDTIPALDRSDELGRLAAAAQVFKDKATETERLLHVAETSQTKLNELNQKLEIQTSLARSMAEEATAATKAKSEFLANMSHEIRTPMTAILGFAETISDNLDSKEQADAIETIRRNGEHLLAIINDILDLSKVEAGKMSVESIPQDPLSIVREVVSLVQVKADGVGLELSTEFEGPIPKTINTDPTRLRQILINLLGNAIKFTEVGSVRLIASCPPNDGQRLMQFDIVDTGIGLTESQIGRLFQPFSQADTSTTRQFGGTGLGLTVSKRFAEILGGDLTLVESTKGQGTRFRVTVATGSLDGVAMQETDSLLASAPTPTRSTSNADATLVSLHGSRILLAEDGPDNQRLLSFLLKKAGADVQVVDNGQLAFDAATAQEKAGQGFDCILMDMQMPVMDGYRATELLRENGYRGPILALTAHAMDGDAKKCVQAGCNEHLTKPINRAQLISKVHQWVQQGRGDGAAASDDCVAQVFAEAERES